MMRVPLRATPVEPRSLAPSGRGHRGGFTLIEMLVAMAIVGVMVGLSAQSLRRSTIQGRMNENMRTLMSQLQNARLRSVTTGIPHGVFVGGPSSTSNPNTVILFRKPVTAAVSPALYDPANDLSLDSRSIQTTSDAAAYVSFSQGVPADGDATIVFDGFGLPNVGTASPYTITPASITVNDFTVTDPFIIEIQAIAFPTEHRQVLLRGNGGTRTVSP